jgi:hypothetical protein
MARITNRAAAQSCQRGTSPTMAIAEIVPTSGTAMIDSVLAVGGSVRAREPVRNFVCEA